MYKETRVIRYLFGILSIITFALINNYIVDYKNNNICIIFPGLFKQKS